jgi:hypothetical protein
MKIKILFLLLFLNVATLTSQTVACSCGSQASGATIEFSIIDDGSRCCEGRVVQNSGYYFEWAHQGGGVYVMVGRGKLFEVAADAQTACCENS